MHACHILMIWICRPVITRCRRGETDYRVIQCNDGHYITLLMLAAQRLYMS